jgi:hypothetical protein
MPAAPVLVGPVALVYVQSMTVDEGYRIERIAGSSFSQALAPTTKTIGIQAILLGPRRLAQKKALEALALTSRVLVATTAPAMALAGIPVVSGLTVSLDMQITKLHFAESAERHDAIDVSLSLDHVPRTSAAAVAGEIAEMALAAGTELVGSIPAAGAVPRVPGLPL